MATQPHVQTEVTEADIRFPKAVGYCHHCNIAVDDKVAFCEPRCKELWIRERHPDQARKALGRAR